MGDANKWLTTAAMVGAAAAAAAVVVAANSGLTQQEHSFSFMAPQSGAGSRAERAAKHGLPVNERLTAPGLSEYFLNKDGLFIYYRRWMPVLNVDPTPPKGIVVIAHGLGEHIGRYCEVARALNAAGFVVYGLDHQGHGRSEGDRGFVKKFSDFGDDVAALTRIAKKENPKLKCFLLGHSLGGAIAIDTLSREQALYDAAVLSAPAVRVDPSQVTPTLISIVRMLSSVVPRAPIDKLKIDSLCLAPTVVDLYLNDPLVNRQPLQARLAGETLTFQDNIKTTAPKIKLPYLLFHGTKDKMVAIVGSEEFHALTSSTDKKFTRVEGGFHEVLNENPDMVKTVVSYLVSRL